MFSINKHTKGVSVTNILKNFWVLEGLDGAGTTTQLKAISEKLDSNGISHFSTVEPTEYETGRFLRKVLSGEISVPQSTIAHLFSADRDNHINNTDYGILTHINKGEIVISDRYFFSSLAYQSIGFNYEKVWNLNKDFPYPEIVIFIDTPPENCLSRIDSRGNKKEIYEKLEYQKLVRLGYRKCFEKLPEGCHLLTIDGTKSIQEISELIFKDLNIT